MFRPDHDAPRSTRRRWMRRFDGRMALALATAILGSAALAGEKRPATEGQAATPAPATAPGLGPVQDLIFLGDKRPVFLRLRVTVGARPFRLAWMDSVRAMHRFLDRDGDGTVTQREADEGALATLVRVANGGATAMPRGDLDDHPKDGVVSIDELSDALKTGLGPFRVEVGEVAGDKADALFEHLDRDKDGQLDRAELDDAASTLHKLDLDEDERIDGFELEPSASPSAMQADDTPGRRGRRPESPVVDLTPGDSSLRPVRQLLKKYDKGPGSRASGGDNKLAIVEFAIDPRAFARADADGDGALDTEELRRHLARVTPDVELDVTLSPDASGIATVALAGGEAKALPPWIKAKPLGGGDLELAVDEVRLEIHVDDGAGAMADAQRWFLALFEAADADNSGSLEKAELTGGKDHPSPLADLFDILDRDVDGKLSPKEMREFVDNQAEAARVRMVLTASDRGRAIFSILDLDRDRRLGLREVRGTQGRVAAWDRDGNGRIEAGEIPHHYQLTLSRGRLAAIGHVGIAVANDGMAPARGSKANGPNWFRRMDRNRDGDISAREFRGPKAAFERLDRDKDGLIDAGEAAGATPTAVAKSPAGP